MEPILSPSPPLRKQPVPVEGYAMEEELDVIVNQPVSLVVDDPKAERELKKGAPKLRFQGLCGPLPGCSQLESRSR